MRTKVFAGVLMVMMLTAFSGCQVLGRLRPQTPEQEWAVAVLAYTYAIDTAIDLHDAGRITDEQYLQFNELRRHVDRALDAWKMAVEHGLDPVVAAERYAAAMERLSGIISE